MLISVLDDTKTAVFLVKVADARSLMQAIAWGITGAATACFEACLLYGEKKVEQDSLLGETQAYKNTIADMADTIVKSQLLSLHFGRSADMQQLTPLQVGKFFPAMTCS